MLKGRIKRLERNIAKIQGKGRLKIWLINVSLLNSKKETTAKKKIQDIMSGKVSFCGNYFPEKDKNVFVISAVPRPRKSTKLNISGQK